MTSNKSLGFNLLELMVVIVILAIIMSVAVIKYASYSRRAEIMSAYSSAKAVEAAIFRKINIQDYALSSSDISSFNLDSVVQKNVKYFASINIVDAAVTSPSTSLPAIVLAEITKSIPISNIIAHAKYDLTATCRLIDNKPAQWFNIFYYLPSADPSKQQISSTIIGIGAKLDCMPSTYQKILCSEGSYSKDGTCVVCTALTGAIKPCSSTSDTTCVNGATQVGSNCKCNTGTYWGGSACSTCTPLTGSAGTVQACSDTSDAICIGGTIKSDNTCSCGANKYWNGSSCTSCTSAITTGCDPVTGGATSCGTGYKLSGISGAVGTTCVIISCTNTAVASCNASGIPTSCNDGYFLTGPSGVSGTTCSKCPSGCSACTSSSNCTACTQGNSLHNNLCYPPCDSTCQTYCALEPVNGTIINGYCAFCQQSNPNCSGPRQCPSNYAGTKFIYSATYKMCILDCSVYPGTTYRPSGGGGQSNCMYNVCPFGCTWCSNPTTCTQCGKGFITNGTKCSLPF